MCTLIIGQDVLAPGSVLIAGNRDEDPARPSRPPGVLRERPRRVGGADAVAGGTWMAIRERRAAVAMLNRWSGAQPAPPTPGQPQLRSRGLLTLDLAAADDPRATLLEAVHAAVYAPFTCVYASPAGSWLLAHRSTDPASDSLVPIPPGWHVLTHRDLDDPAEPRAAHLVAALHDFRPSSVDQARAHLMTLLASHGPPAVCIHEGRMVTVSSFVVWLAPDADRYHHLDGRPCERTLEDFSHLLEGAFGAGTPA
jgi:uncharacterized protein with NRDE domain